MNQNQLDSEDSQQIRIMHQANEWKQKSSITMYVMSFMVGLLIIIMGFTILKVILDYVGMWATISVIAILSVLLARKL